jgi:uncharacterized protein YcnI
MFRRLTLALAAGVFVLLATATPASAHVTVQPGEAEQGGYTKLTFRTPNESDTAATIKLEVELPAEIDGARTKPVPGWNATVDGKIIRWEGGRIEPGQFQEFEISVGPLPEVDQVEFKATQTYDDGLVVRWADPVVEGEEEPEHPVPTLELVATGGDDAPAEAAPIASVDDDDVDTAKSYGFIGMALGAVGAIFGLGALAVATRKRKDA